MTPFRQFTVFILLSMKYNFNIMTGEKKRAHKMLMVSIVAVNHQIEEGNILQESFTFYREKYSFSISYQLIIH